jgi:hypothetical protein
MSGLSSREEECLAELRAVLVAASYGEAEVRQALGESGELVLTEQHVPIYSRRLNADSPLRELVRLFLLGESLPMSSVVTAFTPMDVAVLGELGLVELKRGLVRPLVNVVPFREGVFVHDSLVRPPQTEDVSGISPASRVLASLAVTLPVESALDVGTGCGVHAVRAARHVSRVVATDINPRAVRFTLLSAALSGVANVEARHGNWFEPAGGEEFDLIMANLPYVVSPDRTYVFRDGGEPGDNLSRIGVEQAARALREGGFAQIMVNWASTPADWSARPRRWVVGSGCDVWVLRFHAMDPLDYAVRFLAPLGPGDPGFEDTLERWIAYYRSEGIEELTAGIVILRRRDGNNWVRADDLPSPSESAVDQIVRVFAAQTDLAELANERALLDYRLRLVEPHRLEQTLLFHDGAYEPGDAQLQLVPGLGVRAPVGPLELPLLFHLDGSRPLGHVLTEVCQQTGRDLDASLPDLLRTAYRLYELGFLERL